MAKVRICKERECKYPAYGRSPRCGWHYALHQNIEWQVEAAIWRYRQFEESGREYRARVPAAEWPDGERWCSGCQSFVPLFYTQGSRCRACASRANHAGHISRTYGLDEETYRAMLAWQGGRCYICRKLPGPKRRMAVDHDHVTGEVRGLLCANDEWGCNRAVLGNVRTLEMARRIVLYYEQHPIDRFREGQPFA